MVQAYLVALPGHFETALRYAAHHVGRMIHLTVAVGDAGEVEGGLLEAERGDLVRLAVPEQLEYVQGAARGQGARGAGAN